MNDTLGEKPVFGIDIKDTAQEFRKYAQPLPFSEMRKGDEITLGFHPDEHTKRTYSPMILTVTREDPNNPDIRASGGPLEWDKPVQGVLTGSKFHPDVPAGTKGLAPNTHVQIEWEDPDLKIRQENGSEPISTPIGDYQIDALHADTPAFQALMSKQTGNQNMHLTDEAAGIFKNIITYWLGRRLLITPVVSHFVRSTPGNPK